MSRYLVTFPFYIACVFLAIPSIAAACSLGSAGEGSVITHVHDGDTVFTEDRRKLRIIGLDTPELARENKPAEPLAIEARDFLRSLLASSAKVTLVFDKQRKDRYQRELAHVFLASGENAAERILRAGLASLLIIPPNTEYSDCYVLAQRHARERRLGIWRLPEWQPIQLAELEPYSKAQYRLLVGTVAKIYKGQNNYWIQLVDKDRQLRLLVRNDEWPLFDGVISEALIDRKLLVQGWINSSNQGLFMRIRHPGALQILSE